MARVRGRTAMVATIVSLLSGAYGLAAQSVSVRGQVLHGRTSSRPLAGQWVVLQQLERDGNVPLDSARSDASGRYRVSITVPDTAAHYLLTTSYQDVNYFSETFQVTGSRMNVEPIVVFDTTSAGPAMRLERRLVAVFRRPGQRNLTIQDMVEVANPGDRTRFAPDSSHPVWTLVLPAKASGWAPLEGNLSLETIWLTGDTVKVFAPIWPGAPLRASFEYAIPGSSMRIPIEQWTGELGILVEDSAAGVSGAGLVPVGMRDLGGRRFADYRVRAVDRGAEVRVAFSRGVFTPEQLIPYLVGAVALVLAWGLWTAVRRKPKPRLGFKQAKTRD